jgi:two-component system sensor histidine kinase YesM
MGGAFLFKHKNVKAVTLVIDGKDETSDNGTYHFNAGDLTAHMVHTLRFKFVIGFLLVTTPLFVFLFFNNLYAMQVVRDQVAQSYSNLLPSVSMQMDRTLEETNKYLFQIERGDYDVNTLHMHAKGSSQYELTKIRISHKLMNEVGYNSAIDSYFVYMPEYDDFIVANLDNQFYKEQQMITEEIPQMLKSSPKGWEIVYKNDEYHLVRTLQINPKVVIGAWIRIDRLLKMFGQNSQAIVVSDQGVKLTDTEIPLERILNLEQKLRQLDQPYQMVTADPEQGSYLMIGNPSKWAQMKIIALIPEHEMLKGLPYFQFAIYFIPVGAVLLLFAFLFLLRNVLLKPLKDLMTGMRRLSLGQLDIRLPANKSAEFGFLTNTFNDMAYQIENLKINVYEEQLRVQKAEMKHLQVQINPHFYLNTLNIIYNLAALKNYASVQKMSLYLADYFRFTVRTHRSSLPLSEELRHIHNYMEIQSLRYPDQLSLVVDVSEPYLQAPIPPLTIQPFVENAIIHGLDKMKPLFRIVIRAVPDPSDPERYFFIDIEDNGRGVPEEKLGKLTSGRYMKEEGDQHLGIWNVHHRLMIHYGEGADLQFNRGMENGLRVTLRIPLPASVERKERLDV